MSLGTSYWRIATALAVVALTIVVLGEIVPVPNLVELDLQEFFFWSNLRFAIIALLAFGLGAYLARTDITVIAAIVSGILWCVIVYLTREIAPPGQKDVWLIVTRNAWGVTSSLLAAIVGAKLGRWLYLRRVEHAGAT